MCVCEITLISDEFYPFQSFTISTLLFISSLLLLSPVQETNISRSLLTSRWVQRKDRFGLSLDCVYTRDAEWMGGKRTNTFSYGYCLDWRREEEALMLMYSCRFEKGEECLNRKKEKENRFWLSNR